MHPSKLPIVGVISNTDKDIFGKFTVLRNKNVLCIGFTESEIIQYVERYAPARITTLTNWVDHADAQISRFPLVIGDITARTQFEDNAFDSVLTLSVLEHLSDLWTAFDEMIRIVKSGGEMIHMFGPAWSCAYGHHLYADPLDPLLNFPSWQLPAHLHLLCDKEEIVSWYRSLGYPERATNSVIQWFYETPIINRAFYDDYIEVFSQARLQMDRVETMYNLLPREHEERLMAAYPGRRDFSTYGGKYRLIVKK